MRVLALAFVSGMLCGAIANPALAQKVDYILDLEPGFNQPRGTGTITVEITGDPATSRILRVAAFLEGIDYTGNFHVEPASVQFNSTDLIGFKAWLSFEAFARAEAVPFAQRRYPALVLTSATGQYEFFSNEADPAAFTRSFSFTREAEPLRKIFFVNRTAGPRISSANLDGSDLQDIPLAGLSLPSGLMVDTDRRQIYWSDINNQRIYRANYDGSNQQSLLVGLGFAGGMALDAANNTLYYTDSTPDVIGRVVLDGSDGELLVNLGDSVSEAPVRIQLDVANNKMYWTNSARASVQRADLDGSNVETIVQMPAGETTLPLALDLVANKLYWGTTINDAVYRANLDGSGQELLINGLGNIDGIALDVPHNHMYISAGQAHGVYRADLTGANLVELIDFGDTISNSILGGIGVDNAAPVDADNDGIADAAELAAGSDPMDANSPRAGASTSPDPAVLVASSVLPSSRSVQVGQTATAFATIVSFGTSTARRCTLFPITAVPADFFFQQTDPSTNSPIGAPNVAVDIAAGSFGTFVFGFTPNTEFSQRDVQISYRCQDAADASVISGVNTLGLAASSDGRPDVIALAATVENDGIVHVPSRSESGFFAVATSNIGGAGDLSVTADTGGASLPLNLSLCQTEPVSGACLAPPAPAATALVVNFAAGATPTFALFVQATEPLVLDPANARIFVRFVDASSDLNGATSVAVESL